MLRLPRRIHAAKRPPSAAAPQPEREPDREPGVTADYSGILSMDAIEGGCPYLQAANGDKLQVIYPEGWQLNKSPLELVAPDGSVHARPATPCRSRARRPT